MFLDDKYVEVRFRCTGCNKLLPKIIPTEGYLNILKEGIFKTLKQDNYDIKLYTTVKDFFTVVNYMKHEAEMRKHGYILGQPILSTDREYLFKLVEEEYQPWVIERVLHEYSIFDPQSIKLAGPNEIDPRSKIQKFESLMTARQKWIIEQLEKFGYVFNAKIPAFSDKLRSYIKQLINIAYYNNREAKIDPITLLPIGHPLLIPQVKQAYDEVLRLQFPNLGYGNLYDFLYFEKIQRRIIQMYNERSLRDDFNQNRDAILSFTNPYVFASLTYPIFDYTTGQSQYFDDQYLRNLLKQLYTDTPQIFLTKIQNTVYSVLKKTNYKLETQFTPVQLKIVKEEILRIFTKTQFNYEITLLRGYTGGPMHAEIALDYLGVEQPHCRSEFLSLVTHTVADTSQFPNLIFADTPRQQSQENRTQTIQNPVLALTGPLSKLGLQQTSAQSAAAQPGQVIVSSTSSGQTQSKNIRIYGTD